MISTEAVENCPILYEHSDLVWETPIGWNPIIAAVSYRLETWNLLYKRFGVRIIAEQIKDKFGGLRFYYTVRPGAKHPVLYSIVGSILKLLGRIDYGMQATLDKDRVRFRPTKHVFLNKLYNRLAYYQMAKLSSILKPSQRQAVIMATLEDDVAAIIAEAEEECASTCRVCGAIMRRNEDGGLECATCIREAKNESATKINVK